MNKEKKSATAGKSKKQRTDYKFHILDFYTVPSSEVPNVTASKGKELFAKLMPASPTNVEPIIFNVGHGLPTVEKLIKQLEEIKNTLK